LQKLKFIPTPIRLALTSNPTPAQLGFRMPAEWQPHASTWMAWPHDDEQWIGLLEPVRREFTTLVDTIARFESVDLLVADDESERDARARLSAAAIRIHRVPHQDLWLRDSGPIFVARDRDLLLVDWEFNGWGGKYAAELDNEIPTHIARILESGAPYRPGIVMEGGSLEVNGLGMAITTAQCLLAPTRNPTMGQRSIELALELCLGITDLVWLEQGLEGDHTDGHIDTITRFVTEDTIVTSTCVDVSDPNHETLAENLDRLRSLAYRHEFRLVELPIPTGRVEFDGERLPLTYANFYIVNGGVVVPLYGMAEDDRALEILRPLFPNRDVVAVPARALITGGGAFHCVTQQQPVGRPWRAA
jgi:agmatine deiminase